MPLRLNAFTFEDIHPISKSSAISRAACTSMEQVRNAPIEECEHCWRRRRWGRCLIHNYLSLGETTSRAQQYQVRLAFIVQVQPVILRSLIRKAKGICSTRMKQSNQECADEHTPTMVVP